MANLKDQIEKGKFGQPKENAWHWLLTNRGIVMLAWLVCPTGMALTYDDSTLGFIIATAFAVLIPTICLIHDIKWYKELVADNLIKTFKNSKFISKY